MAAIAPLRGLRYNLGKIGSMAEVVAPPYDVIGPEAQDMYYLRHQHNIIRLILAKAMPGDDGRSNRYYRAASTYKRWWIEEVLIRDPEPAIYLYEITYPLHDGREILTRKGFICLLRLDEYGAGAVKPHERTFSATKQERLNLISATQANFSQIFTLYDDPEARIINLLEAAAKPPAFEFVSRIGTTHKLSLVVDPETHRAVARAMTERTLYIADGHHRYETCLAYRNQLRSTYPQAHPLAPFNYTTVYATAMQDQGLTILPAHRLIKDLDGFDEAKFVGYLEKYFDIQEFPLAPDPAAARRDFISALGQNGDRKNVIGFCASASDRLRVLTLKPGVMEGLALHPAMKDLDVMVLNEIIYGRCLGLSLDELDNERRFFYDAELDSAIKRIRQGEAALGFLLNPTRIEQVQAVANAGLVMPRKSTYFYPKVTSGLVINPLIPSETVADPLA